MVSRISRVAMVMRAVLVLAVLGLLLGVDARSPKPPPVRRVHTPRSNLSILPRSAKNPLSRPRSFSAPPPPPHELLHSDSVHLVVSLPDLAGNAHILLRPSEHIIHPNAFVRVDGVPYERIRAEDYKLYTGEVIHESYINRAKAEEVAGMHDGRGVLGVASVMVHHPGDMGEDPLWEGSFSMDGTTYHAKPTADYNRLRSGDDVFVQDTGRMVVFRDADMYTDEPEDTTVHSCGHDAHEHNSNLTNPIWQNRHADVFTPFDDWEDIFDVRLGGMIKRQDSPRPTTGSGGTGSNYINSINSTQGCPNSQQIVYVGLALDCNYVQTYGGGDAARRHILSVMNQVSDLYRRTFNISLGVIELVVENSTCPSSAPSDKPWNVGCDAGISLDERLSRFSQWRGQRSGDGAGLWHLMSACATDREVGVAWLGTVCQSSSTRQGSTYVSGTGVSTALQTEWSLVAHEMGHGFGAIHDCYDGCSLNGNCCPYSQSQCNARGRFIMNPTTSNVETAFSGCTLGNICSNIGQRTIQTSCFQTPGGRAVISEQQCGNGIIDDGEDCDPGFNSTSPCCDPDTCRFRSGAVCDPNNKACCTDQCQFSSNGTVCRPAADSRCDFQETCPGNSADCPADRYRDDGTSCGNNGLECAAGRCTSLDQQCQQSSGSMNLTTACGQKHDTSCVISCRDPRSSNQCIVMQTPLLDGSPCGWAGRCYDQSCQEGSWQSQFSAMYRQNLQISIPVTIVVGLIILLILFFIVRAMLRCCGLCLPGPRKQKRPRGAGRPGPGPNGAYPPPPMRSSGYNATGPNQFANNPPPPAVGRHSGSVNSQDPITQTHVYGRDGGYGPGQHGWAYSNGGGGGGGGGGLGGVDPSQWNGPNYGREQAYGR